MEDEGMVGIVSTQVCRSGKVKIQTVGKQEPEDQRPAESTGASLKGLAGQQGATEGVGDSDMITPDFPLSELSQAGRQSVLP